MQLSEHFSIKPVHYMLQVICTGLFVIGLLFQQTSNISITSLGSDLLCLCTAGSSRVTAYTDAASFVHKKSHLSTYVQCDTPTHQSMYAVCKF